jgi:hypothetical protein
MIFPDLPKRHRFHSNTIQHTELAVPEPEPDLTVATKAEAWFAEHFPDQSSTAIAKPAKTPSFAEDPRGWIEFILIIVFLIGWAVFWKLQQ